MTCAGSPRMLPSLAGYSTETPLANVRWKERLRYSRVAPSGRVSLRRASPNADAGRLGFNSVKASRSRRSKTTCP